MVKALPKWEMIKYAVLWSKFKSREFTNQQAQGILKEKDRHILSVFFYDLKQMGWVQVKRDSKDQRKKVYKLKEPNQAIKELAKEWKNQNTS